MITATTASQGNVSQSSTSPDILKAAQSVTAHSAVTMQPEVVTTQPDISFTQGEQWEARPTTMGRQPARPESPAPGRITGLEKWEGKIVEIDDGLFTAELYPLDREGMPITADFDLELLGDDADGVIPGDVFYLSVRTVKAPGMRPHRTESLRLRRLGRITPDEIQVAYAKADALMERLEHLFD
ncbi:hypothetical protein [Kitasatospora sp. DSM 101779]|uniref:hypothetical protein n=1 Tax=Kitasatospora sp. DSM 101779 TaxID=2853165 RepID=UPI0021D920EC|nr:hypothetical protein [Kitasatospora sp. DSM 101779]MCU7822189.1 hypothetical protein [Kitasatospora sp. DSM 101779]